MRYTLLPQPRFKISDKRQVELSKLYSKLKGQLKRTYNITLKDGELFNSGYHGLVFTINGDEFIIIDQPGKIGLEDQSSGYIRLEGPYASQSKTIVTHKARRFGDTEISDEERKAAYSEIPKLIIEMLNI